jgi:hypothetical protein
VDDPMRPQFSSSNSGLHPAGNLFFMPAFHPPLTYGLGNHAAYQPGPGGPIPDPRRIGIQEPGPVYGRVGSKSILRAFSPGNIFPMLNPWPQMVVNNQYATAQLDLFVPGWNKPPPTATSGF